MRRHLPRLLLTGALLSPAISYALGLGEIRLNSALNQPFDADIEVIAPTREELAELRVTLASNELFSRYGIDRPAYLSSFEFAVSRTRDGNVTIKVTSNRSVTEPFVTLLVEANWGRGRLLREYTVLLDPPVFTPSQPEANKPVTAPQAGAQPEGRIERTPAPEQTRPVPPPEAVSEEPTPAATPSAAPESISGTYEVQRNDTLSQIARRVNPGASGGAQNQTMIALFRANPEAFAGNINRLKAGSVLRVPDLAEIDTISRSEASAEVAQQQQAWSSAFRAEGEDESSRLRLVTPEETPPATVAPTTPSAATQPAAAAAPGATGTTPATAPDKRLEVTSPGLAGVQQGATETPPAAQPETPVEQATPPAATETPPAATETPAAEPEKQARPVRPRPQPVEEPAPSLMSRIGEFWWAFVVAGVLLVLSVIMVFLKRRREAAGSPDLEAFSPSMFEPREERASAASLSTASRERADVFSVDDDDFAEEPVTNFRDADVTPPVTAVRNDAPVTRPSAAVTAPKPIDDTLSSETSVRLDQQDALAEADFHMAYGLYDQAADLVKIAIDREPERRDLKLKLLEIYFVWGNRDLFLDTARDLYNTRDQEAAGEWDKVLIMGRQIAPEDAMFKGDAGSARLDLVDVNLEGGENRVDVDLFAEPSSDDAGGLDLEFTSGERKAPVGSGGSSDLDFLLDEPKLESDDEPTREMDPLARTQETPTIESPMLDRSSQTVREKIESQGFGKSAEQTAELSLDDLGLDVDSLETTGALEHTASLEKEPPEETVAASRVLRDDEMTQLAPSLASLDRATLSSLDRTMEAPRPEKFDIESTGTIYIDQVDLSGNDTVEQPRIDIDSTASMSKPREVDLDVDLGGFDETPQRGGDTLRQPRADSDRFSDDVFADRTSEFPKIDLDVGEALGADDHAPTNKQVVTEMELSELEPVTMSEVGTKLDLARAYMDMGDPDGARSILEEVLQEGTSNQKQEAQRLLDSIR
ncbi:pilus assembly protein FimV [Povalibacter uvarum]|uniref:Pilus assembly protein FimV n=1 Tax=Povalibacter uvarum TaxID=732238 RepID=A0A841HFM2_9GAMM|nr:FimV/HubP family polar landmark protein [Povalibacter uvarum]MBB6091566.1 pilus assembly protein FimV [Povalibacter uvarum]